MWACTASKPEAETEVARGNAAVADDNDDVEEEEGDRSVEASKHAGVDLMCLNNLEREGRTVPQFLQSTSVPVGSLVSSPGFRGSKLPGISRAPEHTEEASVSFATELLTFITTLQLLPLPLLQLLLLLLWHAFAEAHSGERRK